VYVCVAIVDVGDVVAGGAVVFGRVVMVEVGVDRGGDGYNGVAVDIGVVFVVGLVGWFDDDDVSIDIVAGVVSCDELMSLLMSPLSDICHVTVLLTVDC